MFRTDDSRDVYLKQNVHCCRTEAVQGRALAVTSFTKLSSWPSVSSYIIFISYKFSNLEIYSTYITLEFKDVILDKSVLMTLIKCTTDVPKEGSLSHKITLQVLTKLNAAALFQ